MQQILLLLIESGTVFCAAQLIYVTLFRYQPDGYSVDFKNVANGAILSPVSLLITVISVSPKIIHIFDPKTD